MLCQALQIYVESTPDDVAGTPDGIAEPQTRVIGSDDVAGTPYDVADVSKDVAGVPDDVAGTPDIKASTPDDRGRHSRLCGRRPRRRISNETIF